MKLIEELKIKNNIDLIYAKTTLKNLLKKRTDFEDPTFLILSIMELSTNLIKHANGGVIWLLEKDKKIMIAALDNGNGINDIEWAREKGTTTKNNSLGLGLYQLSRSNYYNVEIVSFKDKDLHGTLVLLFSKKISMDIVKLQINYMCEEVCGDVIAKKGKFLLLGDASGHGKKANKTAKIVESYFYNEIFSCLIIDDFFKKIHNYLLDNSLRGIVLSIIELSLFKIEVCGIGNIYFWEKKDDKYINHSQKDGIIGEVFNKSEHKSFDFYKGSQFIGATDGIEVKKMNKLLSLIPSGVSPLIIAISTIYFASVKYDDKSVIVISNNKGE